MTERTIRSMAKELAGIFYHESNRTAGFRRAYPTFKDYMKGLQHQPNGDVLIDKPGWVYHITLAKKVLASMLNKPDVSPLMKERIADAFFDEASRQQGAKTVTQMQDRPH